MWDLFLPHPVVIGEKYSLIIYVKKFFILFYLFIYLFHFILFICLFIYFLQTIHKSGTERLDVKNILPSSCPFMVQLHKFYEGVDAIYLLLQLASGGKLWKYISSYLQTGAQDNFTDYSASGSAGGRNIYKGCKLHNSSTFHEQLPNYSLKENSPAASLAHSTTANLEALRDQNTQPKEKQSTNVCIAVFSKKTDSEHVQFVNTNSTHYSQDLSTKSQAEQLENNRPNVRAQRCSEFSLSESSIDKVDVPSGDKTDEASTLGMEPGTAGRFQDLLTNTEHHLENFSITSNDSSEVRSQRHSSGFSETINVIPEDSEILSHSPKRDRIDIKSDHLDEVFLTPPQEPGEGEDVKPNFNAPKSSPKSIKTSDGFSESLANPDDKLCGDSSISVIKTDSNSASTSCISESNGGLSDNEGDRDFGSYDTCKYGENLLKVESFSSQEIPSPKSVAKNSEDSKPHSVESLPLCKEDLTQPVAPPQEQTVNHDAVSENCSCSAAGNVEQNMPLKHSFTEICRSASFESNLKSPSKSKSRRVFEELDGIGNWSSEALLPESCIKNWAAEIVVALAYLHAQGIICR